MTERERFSLASAFEAADEDRVAEWVGEFLADRGSDNATLAAALAEQPHYWLGPIRLPVNDLVQLAGPSEEEVCPVEPDEWDEDVETMQESLEEGWQPPPLLVEFGDGELLVQDGNHRYDALVDAGSSHVWAFVWFDEPDERARFCADRPDIDDGGSVPISDG